MLPAVTKSERGRNTNTFHSNVSWADLANALPSWPKSQKAPNHISLASFSKVTNW